MTPPVSRRPHRLHPAHLGADPPTVGDWARSTTTPTDPNGLTTSRVGAERRSPRLPGVLSAAVPGTFRPDGGLLRNPWRVHAYRDDPRRGMAGHRSPGRLAAGVPRRRR